MCSSFTAYAQKIEKNEIDDFTGERVVYTNWERLHWGVRVLGKQILTRFGFENGSGVFLLNWVCETVLAVREDDKILFKLDNGEVHELVSNSYEIAAPGAATVNMLWGSTNSIGLSLLYKGDLSFFGKGIVTKIRVNTTDGYIDIDLKKKEGEKLRKQYNVFSAAIK